jgi:hypothetical protein
MSQQARIMSSTQRHWIGGEEVCELTAAGLRTLVKKWAGVRRVATPRCSRASLMVCSTNPWSVLPGSCVRWRGLRGHRCGGLIDCYASTPAPSSLPRPPEHHS